MVILEHPDDPWPTLPVYYSVCCDAFITLCFNLLQNEETLKKYVSEIMEKLKKSEEKSISAKKTADEIEAK